MLFASGDSRRLTSGATPVAAPGLRGHDWHGIAAINWDPGQGSQLAPRLRKVPVPETERTVDGANGSLRVMFSSSPFGGVDAITTRPNRPVEEGHCLDCGRRPGQGQ